MIEQRDLLNNQITDLKFCTVLMKLRQMGLLKKEDIQRYGLLNKLCCHSYFAENRFQFLTRWEPNALTQPDEDGSLTLHYVTHNSSIQGFKMVFEYGIRYHPKKKGINLLFRKNNLNKTPFQLACERFGYDEVMKIVDDTLTLYSDTTTPINVEDALITAAIDENIHLDCVYFLLQRQPDVLVKLLLSQSVVVSSNNDNNNNSRDSSSKKGKRKRNSNGAYRRGRQQKTDSGVTTRQQRRQKSTR